MNYKYIKLFKNYCHVIFVKDRFSRVLHVKRRETRATNIDCDFLKHNLISLSWLRHAVRSNHLPIYLACLEAICDCVMYWICCDKPWNELLPCCHLSANDCWMEHRNIDVGRIKRKKKKGKILKMQTSKSNDLKKNRAIWKSWNKIKPGSKYIQLMEIVPSIK